MPLDPQVAALLAQMQEAGAKPFEELSVPEARVAARSFADLQGEPEPVARIDHIFIPGPTADLPARIYTPEGEGPHPGLVYFHGSRLGRAQHRGVRHHDARARQLHRLRGRRRQLPEGARAPVPGPVRGLLGHDAVDVRERRSAQPRPRADRRDRRQRGRQPRRRRDPARPRRGRAAHRLPGAHLPRRRAQLGHRVRARERRGLPAPARVHALVLGPLRAGQVARRRLARLAAEGEPTTPACRPRSSPPPSSTRSATTAAPTTPPCTTRACP